MLTKNDPNLIASYLEDYSNISGGFCDAVYFPETETDIRSILTSSAGKKIPITLTGAGTGVTGGRVPFGGSVLSLEKMDKIEEIKALPTGEGIAVVQPGVILQDFLQKIDEQGLFYPPDPTEKTSFLGGNVATSASGARSFKFGTARDYVSGLRVMLSNGEMVDIERGDVTAGKGRTIGLPLVSGGIIDVQLPGYDMPDVKNAAGYYARDGMDAVDLFIGQEGTLGVITRISLRLLRRLHGLLDCYAFFRRQEDALTFVRKARALSRGNPDLLTGSANAISLEFFDLNALQLLRERHKNIPKDAASALYFEQEISKENESDVMDAWAGLITECGGSLDDTWFAQTAKDRDELMAVRHDLPDMVNEYIKRHKQTKIGTDIAVGLDNIEEMIGYYSRLLTEADLRYIIFGHIGDSHLHVNILPKDSAEHSKGKKLYELFVKKAVSLGGTVSAEHGIGKLKHPYLEVMYGRGGVEEMAHLKKTLDPACILGLDNIFPKEMLG
ncbi:MAG: FAD-binding protein [Candidatus Omnitrophica bacterium]|nr:FAD-binding protein [Candidatus Omnitrophota bacterium]